MNANLRILDYWVYVEDELHLIDLLNPVAYLIRINRMVMLKGSTLHDLGKDFISLTVIAVCFTAFAVWRYRKTA